MTSHICAVVCRNPSDVADADGRKMQPMYFLLKAVWHFYLFRYTDVCCESHEALNCNTREHLFYYIS